MSQMLNALRVLQSRGVYWKAEHGEVPSPHFALPAPNADDAIAPKLDEAPISRSPPTHQIVVVDVDEAPVLAEKVVVIDRKIHDVPPPRLLTPQNVAPLEESALETASLSLHDSAADQWLKQQLADPICFGEYSRFAAQLLAVTKTCSQPIVSMFGCGSRNAGAPAAMLAATTLAAGATRKVLLVDADSSERQATQLFELGGHIGLADILAGTDDPESVLLQTGIRGLAFVPFGSPRKFSYDQPWGTLTHAFQVWLEQYEYIVLSSGRSPSSNSISIASTFGTSILVVELGAADQQQALARRDHLLRAEVRLAGSLVIGASRAA